VISARLRQPSRITLGAVLLCTAITAWAELDLAAFDRQVDAQLAPLRPADSAEPPGIDIRVTGLDPATDIRGFVELIDADGSAWLPTLLMRSDDERQTLTGKLPPLPPGVADMRINLRLRNDTGIRWLARTVRLHTGGDLFAVDWTIRNTTTGSASIDATAWSVTDPRPLLQRLLPTPFGLPVAAVATLDDRTEPPPGLENLESACAADPTRVRSPFSALAPAARAHWRIRLLAVRCALWAGRRDIAFAGILRAADDDQLRPALAAPALELARSDIDHQRHERALATLDAIDPVLPDTARDDWRHLRALAYLGLRQPDMASETLSAGRHLGPLVHWESGDPDHVKYIYMRMNLAIALAQSGHKPLAMTLLDDIGRRNPDDDETLALRERANAMLGWMLLRDGHGANAVAVFDRMFSGSQAADMAMLGLGWALAGEPGSAHPRPRLPVDASVTMAAPTPTVLVAMERADVLSCEQILALLPGAATPCSVPTELDWSWPDDEEQRRDRALSVWSALLDRQTQSVASIEAAIAAADILIHRQRQATAGEQLDTTLMTISRTDSAIAEARRHLAGALPTTPTARPGTAMRTGAEAVDLELGNWLASAPVHQALETLQWLDAPWVDTLEPARREHLRAIRQSLLEALVADGQSRLDGIHERLRRYEFAARFRLARLQDAS